MKKQKRIPLKYGSARVDEDCSPTTIDMLNKMCELAYEMPTGQLNKALIRYQFLPDPELLNFAKQFSDIYKKLTVGEYFSDEKKYHIKYLERIKDKNTGRILNTGARISNMTGIIELDKYIFKRKEYTPDFLFFIILWCVACNEQENKENMKMADKMVMEYYLTTERSKKNLEMGLIKLFSKALTDMNKERYELIAQMLGKNCS